MSPKNKPTRFVDSMALLDSLWNTALDEEYATATRSRNTTPRSTIRRRIPLTLVMAICAGIALSASVVGLLHRDNRAAHQALVAQAEGRTAKVNEQRAMLKSVQDDVDRLSTQALGSDAEATMRDVTALSQATGLAPVDGAGLVLLVNDSDKASGNKNSHREGTASKEEGRVRDRDLQIIVNDLWSSGAEAVDINGQRLTSLTAIRTAGSSILVNFRPLAPPYTIKAVGDRKELPHKFNASVARRYLNTLEQNFGIGVKISHHDELSVNGIDAAQIRFATVLGERPSNPTTSPTAPSNASSTAKPGGTTGTARPSGQPSLTKP